MVFVGRWHVAVLDRDVSFCCEDGEPGEGMGRIMNEHFFIGFPCHAMPSAEDVKEMRTWVALYG